MSRVKKTSVAMLATVIAATFVIAVWNLGTLNVASWSPGLVIEAGGGQAWSEEFRVGVRVAHDSTDRSTKFELARSERQTPEAPVSALWDVVAGPVDITAKGPFGQTEVIFQVDAAQVPITRTDSNNVPRRNIHNAGIQVFDEQLGWLPLKTRAEGDTLLASAAGSGIYRAVWLKTGVQEIPYGDRMLPVDLGDNAEPRELFWLVAFAHVQGIYASKAPRSEAPNPDCLTQSAIYDITAGPDALPVRACMTSGSAPNGIVTVANGSSWPLLFNTDQESGLMPSSSPQLPAASFVESVLSRTLGGMTFVGSQGVGAFGINDSTPDVFSVTGVPSADAVAIELALRMFTSFFPQALLNAHSNTGANTLTCIKGLMPSIADEIQTVAGVLSACMQEVFWGSAAMMTAVDPYVPAFTRMADALAALEPSLKPVTFQLVRTSLMSYADQWFNTCGGKDDLLEIEPGKISTWRETRPGVGIFTSVVQIAFDDNKPVVIIGTTDSPTFKPGDRLSVTTIPDKSDNLVLTLGNQQWTFFRKATQTYC